MGVRLRCLNSAGVRLPRLECGRTALNCRRQFSIVIFASTRCLNKIART
jgi:hypothetical protein